MSEVDMKVLKKLTFWLNDTHAKACHSRISLSMVDAILLSVGFILELDHVG